MIKWVSRVHLGPILYHSETSDFLYFQNQFFDWDFFAASYSKTALVEKTFNSYQMTYIKWLWMHPIVHFGQTIQHLTNISKSLARAQFEIEWFIFYASLNYFQDLNF